MITSQLHQRIVIFASGNGSNAENLIKYFHKNKQAEVTHVFSNNKQAKVLKRAYDLNVNAIHFDRESLYDTNEVLNILRDIHPDLIVLAGFLWLFPKKILKEFPNKVVNLHPALLPKYGGKGMHGKNIHRAVVENKETETGITVHYVNEKYDDGAIITQISTKLGRYDTIEDVVEKIHALEMAHFPKVINKLLFPERYDTDGEEKQ